MSFVFSRAASTHIKPPKAALLRHAISPVADWTCCSNGWAAVRATSWRFRRKPRSNADVFFIRPASCAAESTCPMSEMSMKFALAQRDPQGAAESDLNDLGSKTQKLVEQGAEIVNDPVQSFLRFTSPALQNHVRSLPAFYYYSLSEVHNCVCHQRSSGISLFPMHLSKSPLSAGDGR
jgi:hypothetical protein